MTLDAVATPEAIEARSFAIIDAEISEPRPFDGALWMVARRCIHTLGDTSIVTGLRLSGHALQAGVAALRQGCIVYTDTRMAAAGIPKRRLKPLGVRVIPLLALPGLSIAARGCNSTRACVAVEMVAARLAGTLVVIGNAPTALLALLAALERGAQPPALIVGMPVGFVNAAQSKLLLSQSNWPHFTLLGRKGGSAVAAACVNAMAELALKTTG
ncbi:MAG: cobalt-precorrin-8X methylmutase [Candidatus Desulfovibrio kirbyi]|uniref:Cobalt-precorrin-8X methylmutase n=1 Tax=Candidatus Desulfovibrio kirbyi TaxID=2696086 RepID=A0A6L2R7F1_9BACT|nr:MAG: cobalt-precorrin-8X methylmutase [Candidatus Desulfovibrio kirbyi]